MSNTDPAGHWSGVGQRIRQRTAGREIAGDDSPYFRYKRSLFVGKLLPRMPIEGHSVLEVGCGPGGNLREVSRRNPARLVGCDVSPEMVDLARQNVPSAETVTVDGESLPFSDSEIDLIFTVTVIQHNPDDRAQKLIGEICRVRVNTSTCSRTRPNLRPRRKVAARMGISSADSCHGTSAHATSMASSSSSRLHSPPMSVRRVSVFLRRLDRGERVEGAQPSAAHRVLESSMLPLTRNLDKAMRHYKGRLPQGFAPPELTMMAFRRKDKSN